MSMNFKSQEEFAAAFKQFYATHPEAPVARNVECLNLIMRREFAEQILAGKKKLEFRAYSDHYIKRLIDAEVADYISMHPKDEEVLTFCNDIRQVKKIHFHNYNNSWYLDVECTFNDAFCINDEDIKMLNEKYGCHDFDAELRRLNALKAEQRPWLFYLVCGKVISTNLK